MESLFFYDLIDGKVLCQQMLNAEKEVSLDLSQYPAGIYFVELRTAGAERLGRKIVK